MRLILITAAFLACGALAQADDAPPHRLRGRIEQVEGSTLIVKTPAGERERLRLAEGGSVAVVTRATLADLKPGSFVGAAAEPGPGNRLEAIEVHIFPESLRGFGEGSRRFDLSPTSTMTNGDVVARVDGVSGPTLTITYRGGSQTIEVTQKTAIVRLEKGSPADFKPAAALIAFGLSKAADGALEARAITVGGDVDPPM